MKGTLIFPNRQDASDFKFGTPLGSVISFLKENVDVAIGYKGAAYILQCLKQTTAKLVCYMACQVCVLMK